jgi:hypothetical protein
VVADADDEVGPIRSIASWKEWRALTARFSNFVVTIPSAIDAKPSNASVRRPPI